MRKSIFLLIALILGACTGLGGEPEIVATLPQPTTVPPTAEPAFPQTPPDIANGASIFASRCVECHGESGNGIGNLVESGQIPQAPDMTTGENARLQTPHQWYNIITNGRIENLMPPWQDALSPQERWDVAFYTYTLWYTDNVMALGEQVWNDKCADCPQIDELTNLATAVETSDASFANYLAESVFSTDLSTDEMYAAVAFARARSVANPDSIAEVVEPIAVADNPDIPRGQITGTVIHGTAGGQLPDDLVVQLQYGNENDGIQFAQTTVNDDFTYTFTDIPLTSAYNYSAGVAYRERYFSNGILEGHPEDIDYNLPITVYDLTDDPFVVSVSHIDILIDPITVADVGRGLRVAQRIRYNNSSDRLYTTGRLFGDNIEPSLLIQVPVGALITSGTANNRYLIVEDLESVVDTYPVSPGDTHEIYVEYFVPYTDGAIIDQPFNNAVAGDVVINLPPSLQVVGEAFTEQPADSPDFDTYSGQISIQPNQSLIFEVTGDPFSTTSSGERIVATDSFVPLLIIVIVAIAVIVVSAIMYANRGKSNKSQIDALVRQIAELDAMHESGQINHDVYQRQRQELKGQLSTLMQTEPES